MFCILLFHYCLYINTYCKGKCFVNKCKQTDEGLRITIKSTLDLVEYPGVFLNNIKQLIVQLV